MLFSETDLLEPTIHSRAIKPVDFGPNCIFLMDRQGQYSATKIKASTNALDKQEIKFYTLNSHSKV